MGSAGPFPSSTHAQQAVYDDVCHSTFLAHQIARIYERRIISHAYPGDLATGWS